MRTRSRCERVDLDSAQPQHHRGEQADLARPHDKGSLGVPDLQPLLGEERLFDRLGAHAGRLGEDAEMLEVLRDLHDVFRVVDEELGQIPVTEIDSAFVVDLVAGDVVPADHVEDRLARAADRARDVVAGPEFLDLVSDLDDLSEALVPDDQVLAARRGVAVKGLVDLAVSRIDTDLQHLDQHGTPIGDPAHVRMRLVRQLGDGNLSQMHAIRLAGQYGYGFHRPTPDPPRSVGGEGKKESSQMELQKRWRGSATRYGHVMHSFIAR